MGKNRSTGQMSRPLYKEERPLLSSVTRLVVDHPPPRHDNQEKGSTAIPSTENSRW